MLLTQLNSPTPRSADVQDRSAALSSAFRTGDGMAVRALATPVDDALTICETVLLSNLTFLPMRLQTACQGGVSTRE